MQAFSDDEINAMSDEALCRHFDIAIYPAEAFHERNCVPEDERGRFVVTTRVGFADDATRIDLQASEALAHAEAARAFGLRDRYKEEVVRLQDAGWTMEDEAGLRELGAKGLCAHFDVRVELCRDFEDMEWDIAPEDLDKLMVTAPAGVFDGKIEALPLFEGEKEAFEEAARQLGLAPLFREQKIARANSLPEETAEREGLLRM